MEGPDRQPRLSFRLPLEPARLLRARERIRDYLYEQDVARQAIDDIVLAVEEAMTNAMRHSQAEQDLEVDLHAEGDDLVGRVRDHGKGFDPKAFDPSLQPDVLTPGGRGLYLIGELMDEMELERNAGLEVRMRKRGLGHVDHRARLDKAVVEEGSLNGDSYHDIRQRAIVEEMAEAFATLDWEYTVTYGNRSGLALFGFRREDVLGKSFWDIFPATRTMRIGEAVRGAMELGISSIEEFFSPSARRWVETRVYPTGSGVSIYLRDIDERKRREMERDELLAALQESEERYRGIVETSTEGIVVLDPDGLITYANSRFAEMLGYEVEELVGGYSSVALDPGFRSDAERARMRLRTGEVVREEMRFRHKDGSVVWTMYGARPVRDAAGNHLANLAMHVDITERKRLEQDLARQREQLQHLVRHAATGIYEIDFRGPRFLSVNDFMCTYSGYSREELLAADPMGMLDEDSQTRFRERIAKVLGGEAIDSQVEYCFLTKQGEKRWAVLNITPTFEDGRPVGAFVVGQDVTERKRAEEALRRSEERVRTLYEQQHAIATALQKSLLHPLPEVDGLELAVLSLPANQPELIGGDFGDVCVLAGGQVLVVIGDVAGKGIRAAGLTETVRSTLHAFAAIDPSPCFILRKTNELLMRTDMDEPHVTALVCVIDPATGHTTVASAGHPPAVHLSPFSCDLLGLAFGPPLGTFAAEYTPAHLTLTPDDCLALYTDGVTEARREGEMLGEGRLVQAVSRLRGRPADEVAAAVADVARDFADRLRDDIQIVVVRLA